MLLLYHYFQNLSHTEILYSVRSLVIDAQRDNSKAEYSKFYLKNLRGVSFCCSNVQSVTRKIDDIHILLHGSKIDCLCLVQTFLTDRINDSELEVDGYTLIRHDHTAESGKKGGGGLSNVF